MTHPAIWGLAGSSRQQRALRLLNRDGSFNVQTRGRGLHAFLAYSNLVSTTWNRFFLFVAAVYLTLNGVFRFRLRRCGPGGLVNTLDTGINTPFLKAFFFSIHTSATIGYGSTVPVGLATNILVALESVVSLVGPGGGHGVGVCAVLPAGRRHPFQPERCDVVDRQPSRSFSSASSTPGTTRSSICIVRLLVSRFENNASGVSVRRYYPLSLERESVVFFPLSWTIVHTIDQNSPLYGVTQDELCGSGAEFLILLTGMDETFSQVVNARSSYRADEIVWDAKFTDIFVYDPEGRMAGIDMKRFHDTAPFSTPP